ncbi:uncharacterized protein BKA55DRAFT_598159 [Fusarium redolens]|uniref:SCP domain-containing protein n=1 Tax=Fusarium redolens TaxID=48865 RepID=A0A9P9G8I9_FUSRE|nr:uncharacterized protein BKA55DRAFT_598159 [Fusarium redolens]KAH7233975.1 hypothetical protein BKA55DRAFT_598159 [Fusarium redolens]
MRSSGYITSLVAAGAMAHYEIVTKFQYVTHYVIGGGSDDPQTTCVSQPQKSNFEKQPDVSGQYITTVIYAQPTNVQPVKRPKQAPNQDSVSGFGPSYGLSTDQQEAVNLHNDARKAWADHLASIGFLQHSKGDHGENLYMGTTDSPYSVSVKAFLAENSQYNGEAISGSNYLNFGHYTQCDSSGVSWVVARYQKPGNMKVLETNLIGEKPY